MSSIALRLYQKLLDAPDEKARSQAIVDAFAELEARCARLHEASTRCDSGEAGSGFKPESECRQIDSTPTSNPTC
jgi:hypothetical protein